MFLYWENIYFNAHFFGKHISGIFLHFIRKTYLNYDVVLVELPVEIRLGSAAVVHDVELVPDEEQNGFLV